MSWSRCAEWWRSEVAGDPAYDAVVTPLLLEALQPDDGLQYLDVGCGEGRVMRSVAETGGLVIGVDLSLDMVRGVSRAVVGDAVALPFASEVFDAVYCVLALEHVVDHVDFFVEAARVTKSAGALALVVNHPVWTAPASTPITDDDGEVLWRPGEYFSAGTSELPAGDETVTFHHRSMADLLNSAARAGWSLQRMLERPHHELEGQSGIPRLLACRWSLLP